jgi:hypothetical protein
MKDEAEEEIRALSDEGFELSEKRCVSVATSRASFDFICKLVATLKEKWYNLKVLWCKVMSAHRFALSAI